MNNPIHLISISRFQCAAWLCTIVVATVDGAPVLIEMLSETETDMMESDADAVSTFLCAIVGAYYLLARMGALFTLSLISFIAYEYLVRRYCCMFMKHVCFVHAI